jgi:hypothetical protein
MENFISAPTSIMGSHLYGTFLIFFFIFLIYSIILKGFALWKAARKNQKKWFIALLIINTGGLLELLYIFIFSKRRDKSNSNHQ